MKSISPSIEIVTRAIIRDRDSVLLCKLKSSGHYFLPGGHLEVGETLERGLKREIKEELGVGVKGMEFVTVFENHFGEGAEKHHEIDFVYNILLSSKNTKSIESHIEFHWKDMDELRKLRILPLQIKKLLLKK
jgi:8-oxo-dGTP diphosphatase